MTSKQYYKQTSDMAYRLNDAFISGDHADRVVGNIAIIGDGDAGREEAYKILNENDFFSFDADEVDFGEIDFDNVELELRFHYGIDDFDIFLVNVCDVIDCTDVEGGRVVFSCDGYTLQQSYRPQKPENGNKEKEAVEKTEDGDKKEAVVHVPSKSIFDVFDDIIGCSSKFSDLFKFPSFPKFGEISKAIENSRRRIEESVSKCRCANPFDKGGETKFYNFSCSIDPDGNVHIKRSSNDGTVEKEFKIGDGKAGAKEVEAKDDPRTELKKLVK